MDKSVNQTVSKVNSLTLNTVKWKTKNKSLSIMKRPSKR